MSKPRIAVAAMAVAVALGVVLRVPRGPAACPADSAAVVVDSSLHVMSLCEQGTAVHWTGVRLGRNGMGKGREGDGKTPVGTYALESPRPSAEYGSFALVDYPTVEQRRAGATGGAIGVHGPRVRQSLVKPASRPASTPPPPPPPLLPPGPWMTSLLTEVPLLCKMLPEAITGRPSAVPVTLAELWL